MSGICLLNRICRKNTNAVNCLCFYFLIHFTLLKRYEKLHGNFTIGSEKVYAGFVEKYKKTEQSPRFILFFLKSFFRCSDLVLFITVRFFTFFFFSFFFFAVFFFAFFFFAVFFFAVFFFCIDFIRLCLACFLFL